MKIRHLTIRNFKSIEELHLTDLENALILVGKNSTGKTAVLDAIRIVSGDYKVSADDLREGHDQVKIEVTLDITEQDLEFLHCKGAVSKYRRFTSWIKDFEKKLPSYQNHLLTFTCIAGKNGELRYEDSFKKNNSCIPELFPPIYHIDTQRNLGQFQKDLLLWMEDDLMKQMRSDCCIFDQSRKCNHCFDCIGLIRQKSVDDLNAFEVSRLLDYKLYQMNLDGFSRKLNDNFHRNGGQENIRYHMTRDMERVLSVTAEVISPGQSQVKSLSRMGKGMRSVYMLSLLETYSQGESLTPGIVVVEEPEIFLHPEMQKIAGEILYRLSKKNQVIFTTHSPNLLSNFNTRQIRQMVLNENRCSQILPSTDISRILNDLGYTAGDLMNVNFVFIVEGKQDRSRLPLLLNHYYSETTDKNGDLFRIAIISTNSCTNIKTYANLKYINQIYLKDQFLMIRDGDGKDARELKNQLCHYYDERNRHDQGTLPRVRPENVLILKYYSFENYFLNPSIMTQIGVLEREEDFYRIFLSNWKKQLKHLTSGKHLRDIIGQDLRTAEDVRRYIEEIKTYLRGHNLFDLFYGRFKKQEKELLRRYVELAPRDEFQDILDSIDHFLYFESKRKTQ